MQHVVLLRGINLGPRNRVAMPALRERLRQTGFGEVRTYLQSGNVVLSSALRPAALASRVERLLESDFDVDVKVIVRSRGELAAIVARNPLGAVARDPKRYQVSFLAAKLDPEILAGLERVASGGEQLVAIGRELYAWHPGGVARSRLWARLAAPSLGVAATARNWATVTALATMAHE